MYEGMTMMFPLEVFWSGGESFYVDLWVTDFGDVVSVMATNNDLDTCAGVSLWKDMPAFSRTFVNMLRAGIEDVADDTGERWKTETWTARKREL